MTKQEFLQGLRSALEGEVPFEAMQENLRYYGEYIDTEKLRGSGEAQVVEALGDPRLIAKTIIDTTPGAGEGKFTETDQAGAEYSGEPQRGPYPGQGRNNIHYYNLNKWPVKLAVMLLIGFVFFLVIAIIGGVLSLLLPLLPAILTVALVLWILRGPRR